MPLLKNLIIIILILVSTLAKVSNASENTKKANDFVSDEYTESLDLATAMRIALDDSPDMKAAKEKIHMAEQKYKQVKASYLPTVDIFCSTIKNKQSETGYIKSRLQANLIGLTAERSEDYYNAGLSVQWVLFNGFQRTNSLAAADLDRMISKYGNKNTARNLLFAVAETYFTAQLAKENIKILKADEQFYERLLNDAIALKTLGAGSLNDVLSFEVKLNTSKAELILVEQEYYATLSQLTALLGQENGVLPDKIKLAEMQYINGENFHTKTVSNLIEYAVNNRPDILQYKKLLERSSVEVKIARGKMLPTVWFEGIINGRREDDAKFNKEDFGDSVAVKLSYNIFSGGADTAVINRAKAGRLEKEHDYKKLKIQISSDVKNSFNKLKSVIKTYRLYELNSSLSKKNRDLVMIEYSAGNCSLVRLNEAQRDHSMIRSREALALVSIFQAKFELEANTGEILSRL